MTGTKVTGDVHCLGKVEMRIACAVMGFFFLKTCYLLEPKSLLGGDWGRIFQEANSRNDKCGE